FDVERRKGANHEEQDGNRAEQCEQKAIATYLVGEPAADGAKKAPGKDDESREITGADFCQAVLIVKENREEAGEAEEAAEGEAIEEAEPGGVCFAKNSGDFAPREGLGLARAVFCEHREKKNHEEYWNHRKGERIGVAEFLRESWREESRHECAGVACT